MKDLELKDVLDRQRIRLTKVSVYVNGIWQFAAVQGSTFVDEGQTLYKSTYKFALIDQAVDDPKAGEIFGKPGDYIAIDPTGEVSLITAEQYKQRFPKRVKQPYMPETSSKLKNPNFLTEIVRGSQTTSSNTTPTPRYSPSTGGTSGGSSGGATGY